MLMYRLILQHVLKCGEQVAEPELVLPQQQQTLLLTVEVADIPLAI
jgi:hypothetical protein